MPPPPFFFLFHNVSLTERLDATSVTTQLKELFKSQIEKQALSNSALMPVHFFSQVGSLLKHYKSWSKPTSYKVSHNITKFDLKQKSILKTNRTTYLNEGKNYNPIVELRQYNIVIYIVISLFYFILFYFCTQNILIAS